VGLINWIKGKLCTNNSGHVPTKRYNGMTVDGYVCGVCGYEWYEKKQRNN
jgi:hypothetical protein